MKITTKAAAFAVPVAIVTGVDPSEHKAAELKVVLSGQRLSVVVLTPAQVTVFVNFAVSRVPEFFMKANWAALEFRSVIAAPVVEPVDNALG